MEHRQPTATLDRMIAFPQVWGLHPHFLASLRRGDVHALVQTAPRTVPLPVGAKRSRAQSGTGDGGPFIVELGKGANVGVVVLHGVLDKGGMFGTSTAVAREQIAALESDNAVQGIMLWISSAGGAVAGTPELAEDIAATRKPTVVFGEDMIASAAYWVAAGADRIIVNSSAIVGSLGVVAILEDTSKQFEKWGVDVRVLSTGKLKGAGADGVPLDPEFVREMQGIVNHFGTMFSAAIATGRKMDARAVGENFTGAVWLPQQAKTRGLVDAVGPMSTAFAELQAIMDRRARFKRGY
jgi:signal peptide peptidase SppA